MLPNKISSIGKTLGFLPRLSRYPRFGPLGAYNNILWRQRDFTPSSLPNLAANYDLSDLSSLRNDAGAIPSNGEGIKLVSDKSGNSAVNCLVLNGVAGNYASTPSVAANKITGDVDVAARITQASWSAPAVTQRIIAKRASAATISYDFSITITTGALVLLTTADGSTARSAGSTATPAFANYASGWVRATRVAATGLTTFYTAPDSTAYPTVWTQLGNTVATTAGDIFDGNQVLEIGATNVGTAALFNGNVLYAQVTGTIGGAAAQIFDPSTASKLAPSFVSVTGETWTINTSGATGARISGARDLYQGTAANQPILTIAATGNFLTFDGSNDYLKAAAFSLSQPETVYFVGSAISWTNQDRIFDGNTVNSGELLQNSVTPRVDWGAASPIQATTSWALNTNAVLAMTINGVSSSFRLNRGSATIGDVGAGGMNGFTLGANGSNTGWSNITASEIGIYSAAHSTAIQNAVISYLGRKWRISV
jgi:hypothetical protein